VVGLVLHLLAVVCGQGEVVDFSSFVSSSWLSDPIAKKRELERSCVFASPPEWLGLERLGEIQVHFGGESVRAGEQGERCHPLREGVRIVESPVAPIHLS
jgi:hypothetical protein